MFYQILMIFTVSGLAAAIICHNIESDSTVHTLIEGSTGFSLDLLRVLNTEQRASDDSNGILFSPYSVWSALLVTYMGARGSTQEEIKNVLGLGTVDKVTIWNAFSDIERSNYSTNKCYQTANRIYFQEGTTFDEHVENMLTKYIALVDFAGNAEKARYIINTYVEKQTHNKIKDLIPRDGINSLTRMVVTNAVYFKESWQNQFDPQKTAPGIFTLSSRKEIFVNMMSTKGRFKYGTCPELQCYAIELPYTGNSLSMVILLPRDLNTGVDFVVQSLTPQRLGTLASEMYPEDVTVRIPKFKMEDSFELSSVLSKLGLRAMFDPMKADLSGFTGNKEFAVESVHHKSFIEVNEEGTEAAAATSVVSARSMDTEFDVSYPFLFLIRDNHFNSILFLGTVRKPPEFSSS